MDALLRKLRSASAPLSEGILIRLDLSTALAWPTVLAFITLLCLEWWLRKRRGLV